MQRERERERKIDEKAGSASCNYKNKNINCPISDASMCFFSRAQYFSVRLFTEVRHFRKIHFQIKPQFTSHSKNILSPTFEYRSQSWRHKSLKMSLLIDSQLILFPICVRERARDTQYCSYVYNINFVDSLMSIDKGEIISESHSRSKINIENKNSTEMHWREKKNC